MAAICQLGSADLLAAGRPSLIGLLGETGTGKTVLLRRAAAGWAAAGRPVSVIDACANFRGITGVDAHDGLLDQPGDRAEGALVAVRPEARMLLVIDDPAWLSGDEALAERARVLIEAVRASGGRALVGASSPQLLMALGAHDDLVLFRLRRGDRRLAPLGIPDRLLRELDRTPIGHGIAFARA